MKPFLKRNKNEWHKRFSAEREKVENRPHDHRSRTSITEENICAVHELLEGGRRLTLEEIARSVGISHARRSQLDGFLDFSPPIKKVCVLRLVRGLWLVMKMKEKAVVLLQDNARPHTTAITQSKLVEMHWDQLEHPPYSPDLSPCNYHLKMMKLNSSCTTGYWYTHFL
ncbi:hypothetical protein NQ318_007874 [Aromia moschata]|uniref:Histone-lysine N-methyltransferase SETMAR n=1 Tax=Aromia moschata TaxID=1265417 RepID=A0AAV8XNA8_9CUCU|nr:hypothetical protein NQ318_007874 [Aromia moschata]